MYPYIPVFRDFTGILKKYQEFWVKFWDLASKFYTCAKFQSPENTVFRILPVFWKYWIHFWELRLNIYTYAKFHSYRKIPWKIAVFRYFTGILKKYRKFWYDFRIFRSKLNRQRTSNFGTLNINGFKSGVEECSHLRLSGCRLEQSSTG